jgi:hypothetical protein
MKPEKLRSLATSTMNQSCVIVCERTLRWATAIRRHLGSDIRLRQTRGLGECAHELAAAPASLLALEVTRENLSGVLTLLSDLGRKFPLARAMVLAERGLEPYEWLLREAGAVHFTTSPREPDELARLATRHVNRVGVSETHWAARIWSSLPWSDAATA